MDDKENHEQCNSKKDVEKKTNLLVGDQTIIRSNVINEFQQRNLPVPLQMIGMCISRYRFSGKDEKKNE